MKQRAMRPGADTAVTFAQDTWWCNREGVTILIDSMSDRYRYNVARWLERRAAKAYATHFWAVWFAAISSPYTPNDLDFIGEDDGEDPLEAELREDIAAGKHLEWLHGTKLYRRMAVGLPTPHEEER